MPFVKETVEMKREEFVQEAVTKQKSIAALCRKYGISRPTGYMWLNRYMNNEGFHDKSKAPFHTINKTASEVEERIVQMRLKEPAVGAVKIKRMLENAGEITIPCASTINAILKRNHMITQAASRAATPYKRFEKPSPNVMWQCDFKGNYQLGNGVRCHPLSIIDDHSRYCLCADAKTDERYDGTAESFVRTFEANGLPDVLLCDNGNPWGSSQTNGITRFEIWLMELGILTIHIRAKHPQAQGKVERFNRSFKAERLVFHTPDNMAEAERQRQEYRHFYNNERPHHALNLDTPAQHYRSSEKQLPSVLAKWEYADDYDTRLIKSSGYLTYKGQGYFFSEAFRNKTIAIYPSSVDGFVNLYYRQFRIGRIDLRERCVVSRRVYLMKDDPRIDDDS